ncbi:MULTISPECIES: hypothetical protein [Natrialba]|uniref:Uncharacterized protein n=1 Tax=Natrialba swarupiae TaxID=2448032 RepID=A0A5D5AV01_9EURY|nr:MULTISPECIES: hypothetical protein [Natrialba]MWV39320.1 hypothetical protein [Natrialba sp. INN-245]TYT63450.1 hypothetical protein FYC77_02425 [Natrialba swarupiae]
MLWLVVGVVLIGLGLAGVRYAPAIVEAQHRQGMTPYAGEESLEDDDRVSVTRGVGVVAVLGGLFVVAYSVGVF